MVIKMTNEEALATYGQKLTIAFLGATPKESGQKLGGDTVVRVLYDATHGDKTNNRIKVTDRQRFPAVDVLEAILRTAQDEGGAHFAVVDDIANLHLQKFVVFRTFGKSYVFLQKNCWQKF